jgi:hypothetical protein
MTKSHATISAFRRKAPHALVHSRAWQFNQKGDAHLLFDGMRSAQRLTAIRKRDASFPNIPGNAARRVAELGTFAERGQSVIAIAEN